MSEEITGFAASVDPLHTLSQAGVKDGDVLVFGRIHQDKIDTNSNDVVNVTVDSKFASTVSRIAQRYHLLQSITDT